MFEDGIPDFIPIGPLISLSRLNPYPGYHKLRAKNPVYPSSFGVFIVTGYAEAQALLKDPRLGRAPIFAGLARADSPDPKERRARALADATVLFSNPPDHARLRSFMSRVFQPKVIEEMRPRIERMVDELLDEAGDVIDAIGGFAQPLPVRVIAELIGLPREDWPQCIEWSADLAPTIDAVISGPQYARAEVAVNEFGEYVQQLTRARRKNPQSDLLSSLVGAMDAGHELSEDELISNIMTLFVAGHETTTNLLGNALVLLHFHPEQRALFEADTSLLESMIEEALRFESPIQLASRTAFADAETAGVAIPRGAPVWVLVGAANRDPSRFTDPDRFDIRRSPNAHLAFGTGIHFCLGAALARLEGKVALSRFFQRFPSWRLEDEPLELLDTLTIRGYKKIPVRVAAKKKKKISRRTGRRA